MSAAPIPQVIERFDPDNDGIMEPYSLGDYVRYVDHAAALAASEARVKELQAFAQAVMEDWPEGAPDGGALQDYAEKHGLLREVVMPGPCGEDCGCTEYLSPCDWPSSCYRKTSLLTGRPESDAAIDALLPKGEGETS